MVNQLPVLFKCSSMVGHGPPTLYFVVVGHGPPTSCCVEVFKHGRSSVQSMVGQGQPTSCCVEVLVPYASANKGG